MRRILSLGSGNRGFKERREALFSTLESHDGLTDGYRSEKEKKKIILHYFQSLTQGRGREKRRRTEETRIQRRETTNKKGLLHN